jgi:hypothetical protein
MVAVAILAFLLVTPAVSEARDGEPDCIRGTLHGGFGDCYIPGNQLKLMWSTAGPGVRYMVRPICAAAPDHPEEVCETVQIQCVDPPEAYKYWVFRSTDDGPFEPIASTCLGDDDTGELDVITPEKVLKRMRQMAWPEAEMVIQPPDGRTLVNFETNFLTTTTEPTSQTVQLLGHGVEIEATPVNYLWHFGDGTSQEGSDPGAEYPDLRITHVYEKAGVTVSPSVDVTYQGRYRVDGGNWVPISDTLTVVGTPVDLQVLSATPHLVG